ncbi:hypothetical protein DIPPA_08134 [Diplonema papillatum]|nr:hypothetical protein DIPPA_08134 [Diplonema papillatum]
MAHVCFNVSGTKYEVLVATLLNSPETMLGALMEKWHGSGEFSDDSTNTREVFIDRNGERFQYILDYYRDGVIVLPPHIPYEAFMRDVQFFSLPSDCVVPSPRPQLCIVSYLNGRCYIEGAVVPGTDTSHRSVWGSPVVDNSMAPFPVLSTLTQAGWNLVSTQDIPSGNDKVIQYVFTYKPSIGAPH